MNANESMQNILSLLPMRVALELSGLGNTDKIEEVHMRIGKKVFVKIGSGIRMLDCRINKQIYEADSLRTDISFALCPQRYHQQRYISYRGGIRVGVCGRAVCDKDKIISVDKIDSLNIRIPHIMRGICDPVLAALGQKKDGGGILIYSLPGVGKTTLLRDIAITLSSFPHSKRVCLIDSRCEIGDGGYDCPTLDIYSGYPPRDAIEMAVRTMSPEIIICDEIGGDEEFRALLSLCGKGIPVIASAHAGECRELLLNKNLRLLHENGLFSLYIGIARKRGTLDFSFTFSNELDRENQ